MLETRTLENVPAALAQLSFEKLLVAKERKLEEGLIAEKTRAVGSSRDLAGKEMLVQSHL